MHIVPVADAAAPAAVILVRAIPAAGTVVDCHCAPVFDAAPIGCCTIPANATVVECQCRMLEIEDAARFVGTIPADGTVVDCHCARVFDAAPYLHRAIPADGAVVDRRQTVTFDG